MIRELGDDRHVVAAVVRGTRRRPASATGSRRSRVGSTGTASTIRSRRAAWRGPHGRRKRGCERRGERRLVACAAAAASRSRYSESSRATSRGHRVAVVHDSLPAAAHTAARRSASLASRPRPVGESVDVARRHEKARPARRQRRPRRRRRRSTRPAPRRQAPRSRVTGVPSFADVKRNRVDGRVDRSDVVAEAGEVARARRCRARRGLHLELRTQRPVADEQQVCIDAGSPKRANARAGDRPA